DDDGQEAVGSRTVRQYAVSTQSAVRSQEFILRVILNNGQSFARVQCSGRGIYHHKNPFAALNWMSYFRSYHVQPQPRLPPCMSSTSTAAASCRERQRRWR